MPKQICQLIYGADKFNYELIFSQRKTLAIEVWPDKSIYVKAPVSINLEKIEQKVKSHAAWIKRRIAYFEQYEHRSFFKYYINGANHYYLGKKYRLKIVKDKYHQIIPKDNFLYIYSPEIIAPEICKSKLETWYVEKAKIIFASTLNVCWEKCSDWHADMPKLKIRKMKNRWGSLSHNKRAISFEY